MTLALHVAVLLGAFAVCAWSGRTLARHYQDRWELAASLAVGACLFAALGLAALGGRGGETGAGWPEVWLGLAMAAGLFTGYYRAGVVRRRG